MLAKMSNHFIQQDEIVKIGSRKSEVRWRKLPEKSEHANNGHTSELKSYFDVVRFCYVIVFLNDLFL